MNYIRRKFNMLWQYYQNILDILLISKTKLDIFPGTQFYIKGYISPYSLNRNKFGGSLLLYVS